MNISINIQQHKLTIGLENIVSFVFNQFYLQLTPVTSDDKVAADQFDKQNLNKVR